MFPKPQYFRSEEYRALVRTLPCYIQGKHTCMGQIIDHHVKTGGKGIKCNDYETIPLCVSAHDEIHRGKKTFCNKYGIDLHEAVRNTMIEVIKLIFSK